MSEDDRTNTYDRDSEGGLSRRDLLRNAGLAGAALVVASPLLSAPSALGRGATAHAEGDGDVGATINRLLNPQGPKGTGTDFPIGAVLALSGPASFYGKVMANGTDLAVEHIKAAGGPNLNVTYKDHKSGNPEAGATATRELGIDGMSAVLASYLADFGAMLPGLAQYKMLALDGGGGTGLAFQNKPFFWGTRALTPSDPYPGTYRYVKSRVPRAKRVSFVIWDAGAAFVKSEQDRLKAALPKFGMQLVSTEPVPVNATDYSSVYARLQKAKPDVIQHAIWGPDPGYFMRGYVNTNMKAQVIGSEFTPDAAKVAGRAYNRFWFAFDFFDAKKPPNPWAAFFVQEYRKKYKSDPVFYAADFYENTFAFWDLIRRVLAKGGDIKKGPELQDALVANPSFKSVYGGNKSTVGTLALDLKTHSTKRRAMGLFRVTNGAAAPLATFNIGGTDYKAAAS
jgi:branched-chain amino acid transport system substrate-binding protein